MPLVSVTRLRLRSWRYLLPFAVQAVRSQVQAKKAPGCRTSLVRKTEGLTFWTLTVWDSRADLAAYISDGAHREAMPRLKDWADEAAFANAEGAAADWDSATRLLAEQGRLAMLRHPSPAHREGKPLGSASGNGAVG